MRDCARVSKKCGMGVIDYNEFEDEDQKLRDTALTNLQIEWQPQTILFAAGTKLGE